MEAPTGKKFGPYELLRRLGVGGMAETFVARRSGPEGFQQHVCLKRILPALESDPDFVSLFMREARLSARLHHSNVAQVVDFGVVDNSHYLTLELIDGVDLRFLIRALRARGEAIEPALVVYIAYELAAALDFAHAADADGKPAGIVHRDISPSNILLSVAGEVKLTDFGIAKAINQPGTIQSGSLKGKIPYMAPEYAHRGDYDARSDLFSLGVTLYECLTGTRPFDGDTDADTMRRIQHGDHRRLAEAAPHAPVPFTRSVQSLLAPDPSDRPANAGAFLDSLVGVAPAPLARRTLGALVREQLGELHDVGQLEPTQRVSPGGTVVIPGAKPADEDSHIRPANAEAETKTRLPNKRGTGSR